MTHIREVAAEKLAAPDVYDFLEERLHVHIVQSESSHVVQLEAAVDELHRELKRGATDQSINQSINSRFE